MFIINDFKRPAVISQSMKWTEQAEERKALGSTSTRTDARHERGGAVLLPGNRQGLLEVTVPDQEFVPL